MRNVTATADVSNSLGTYEASLRAEVVTDRKIYPLYPLPLLKSRLVLQLPFLSGKGINKIIFMGDFPTAVFYLLPSNHELDNEEDCFKKVFTYVFKATLSVLLLTHVTILQILRCRSNKAVDRENSLT